MENTETGILLADGFEDALIGLGTQFNKELAVYDYEKCIQILMTRDGMAYEEAMEHMEFNVTGAYVGEQTPVFVRRECLPVT
jgi:hypothetical protein